MNLNILFDDSQPFEGEKLALFELVVKNIFSHDTNQRNEAEKIVERLNDQNQLWLFSQPIIMNAKNAETCFVVLQSLQKGIATKWNLLTPDQMLAVRGFVAELIVKLAGNPNSRESKLCLAMANASLVEIVKKEWRTTWKTAISDIVQASYSSQLLCANNLKILNELSQAVFTYSKSNLTSQEIQELKTNFANEFKSVYDVCDYVAKAYLANQSSVEKNLVKSCLETLQSFLSWMPSYYILMTDLMDVILLGLIKEKKFLISVLKCFEEVFAMDISYLKNEPEMFIKAQEKIIRSFGLFLERIMDIHSPHKSFEAQRVSLITGESSNINFFQIFTQTFAMVLSNFYKTHLCWVKAWIVKQEAWYEIAVRLKSGLAYMAALTEVKDSTLFKTIVEFWLFFLKEIWDLNEFQPEQPGFGRNSTFGTWQSINTGLLNLNTSPQIIDQVRNELEAPLKEGVMFLVMKVPKPQEVLITIDEEGLPKREELINTENLVMYDMVREILRTFAKRHYQELKQIINYKMDHQIDGSEWSYENLNSLSFATGCLAEVVSSEEERTLLIYILRALLNFCASKRNTEDKAVIASNIMHIVSQHQRFLKEYWEFLVTVVRKLLEFTSEKFPGVAEMACNTLLKIAKNLKEEFVTLHQGRNGVVTDKEPYICTIINNISETLSKMDLARQFDFYEAIGYMISAEQNEQTKIGYLISASRDLEREWKLIQENISNKEFLENPETASHISIFIRINTKFCQAIGPSYKLYFERCFMGIDMIYCNYQQLALEMLQKHGITALDYSQMKKYRGVRKDILELLTTFVAAFAQQPYVFVQNYSSLLVGILESYSQEQAEIREPEVLLFLAECIQTLRNQSHELLSASLPLILGAVLPMITQDFNSYIETRMNFFSLLQSIAVNCFQAFMNLSSDIFKTIVDCVVWAMKHETPSIHEIGIETLIALLENINRNEEFMQGFYKFYFTMILSDLLFIMTDKLHSNTLNQQAKCMHILLFICARFDFPVFEGATNNQEAVMQFLMTTMSQHFSNLALSDHQKCLMSIFNAISADDKIFKTALRDYLINLSLYTKSDEDSKQKSS